jgi:beta-glucanase (GH16 family)
MASQSLGRFARNASLRLRGRDLFRARRALTVVAVLWLHGSAAVGAAPMQLNLTALCKPSFDEEFDKLDVSAWGPGTRWIAHTPWNGDFGDAAFTDPWPGFPFTTKDGILSIEAAKDPQGVWRSGLLSSVDAAGHGFSQTYGYFEMRAKLPSGPGVWPAFWLSTAERNTDPSIEIDAMEYYGKFPEKYIATKHVWRQDDSLSRSEGGDVFVSPGSLSKDFHSYGVLVGPKEIIYFLDRREVLRQITPSELTRPLAILVDLALGGGWPSDQTPNPSVMYVDYVRAYPLSDACEPGAGG